MALPADQQGRNEAADMKEQVEDIQRRQKSLRLQLGDVQGSTMKDPDRMTNWRHEKEGGPQHGPLLKGVRFFGDGVRTTSLVMKLSKGKVRFIETIHLDRRPDAKVRIPER